LAIASLALSAGSIVLGPLAFLAFIPGIVCGHLARGQIRRNPVLGGAGLALAGMVVGYALLALTALLILGIAVFIGVRKAQFEGGFRPPPPRIERVEPLRPQPMTQTLHVDVANNPVSGIIEGSEFRVDEATINPGGHLNLRQSQGRPGQFIVIFLFPRAGEGVAGRVWNVPLRSQFAGTKPHVHFHWLEDGGSKRRALSDGYELRLELGQEENGLMPGRLTLHIPGDPGTEVKGDFQAKVQ
jgi:hypothetical protein